MALINKHEFELLIFDLDGTLVDSQADLADSVNHVLMLYGRKRVSLPTLRTYIGSGVVNLMERAMPGLKSKKLGKAVNSFRSHYTAHLLDKTKPYPGIRNLLARAKHASKAVLTNKTEAFARNILIGLCLDKPFKVVWGGDTGRNRKPHPGPVLSIIRKLKADPLKTILIGDSENDILAARAAGIYSGAVGWGYTMKRELLAMKPDYFFAKPADILKILK